MDRIIKHYTVNLYVDTVDEIRSQGFELGPYIRELLDAEVDTLEKKEAKLKELQQQQENLAALIKLERERKMRELARFEDLDFAKEKELEETLVVLDRDVSYFEARRARYNNIFGENFDTKDFQILVNKYKEKKNGQEQDIINREASTD